MPQWKKNVYILWFALFITAICWTMVMPFLPIYLEELGVSRGTEFWTGIIIAAAAVVNMVVSPFWGAVGDRYGRRLMLLRAGVFLSLGYLLLALVRGPYELMLVRMMIGGLTGFVPMAIALVGVSTPQAEVSRALSLIQTAWPSGSIIGPVVGGAALDLVGVRGSSIASAVLVALVTAMVTLAVREEFSPPAAGRSTLVRDLKVAASHRLLMSVVLVTTIMQACIMALEPVLVPFVKQIAGPAAPGWLAGLLFALPGAAFIFMAGWWARQGERIGFARTIGYGLLGSGVLYLLQTFVTSPWQMGFVRLASGVTGAAIGPGVAALLATQVPRDLRGRAFGLNQAASAAGAIVGPPLGGFIGSYVDARGTFVLTAGLFFLGYLWVRRVVAPQIRVAPVE